MVHQCETFSIGGREQIRLSCYGHHCEEDPPPWLDDNLFLYLFTGCSIIVIVLIIFDYKGVASELLSALLYSLD